MARRGRTRRSPRMSCSLTMGRLGGLETKLRCRARRARRILGKASACGQAPTGARLCSWWSASTWSSLARALAPQRDRHPLAGGLQGGAVLAHRLEHIGAGLGAFGAKLWPARAPTSINLTRLRHPRTGVSRASAEARAAASIPSRSGKAAPAATAYRAAVARPSAPRGAHRSNR